MAKMDPPASALERRSKAVLWAQTVLKDYPRIKGNEQTNVQNALVEAVMQEVPLRSLTVAINDNLGHYNISLKGYRNIMDYSIWSHAFHGPNRSHLLQNVGRTKTHLTPTGVIKIIQVHKKHQDEDYEGDEEEINPVVRYDQRAKAVQWAQSVLAEHKEVKPQDRPYVEACLVEAAMQENPLPKALVVGINDVDNCYNITICGYHNPLDDVDWTNTFHGKHRNNMLDNVVRTYTQETDEQGAINVIQVNKVKLSGQREEITSVIPSVSRKVTKRGS